MSSDVISASSVTEGIGNVVTESLAESITTDSNEPAPILLFDTASIVFATLAGLLITRVPVVCPSAIAIMPWVVVTITPPVPAAFVNVAV